MTRRYVLNTNAQVWRGELKVRNIQEQVFLTVGRVSQLVGSIEAVFGPQHEVTLKAKIAMQAPADLEAGLQSTMRDKAAAAPSSRGDGQGEYDLTAL